MSPQSRETADNLASDRKIIEMSHRLLQNGIHPLLRCTDAFAVIGIRSRRACQQIVVDGL